MSDQQPLAATTVAIERAEVTRQKPTVNFYDLIENGEIIGSSHEFTGYHAHLTIRHPNHHEYGVRAWSDSNGCDAESDDEVDFTDYDGNKDEPNNLIEEAAYEGRRDRIAQAELRAAAKDVIASWKSGDLAAAINQLAEALNN